MKTTKRPRPVVTADGDGIVSHAGSYLLIDLADRVGLTSALSRELACLQRRRLSRTTVSSRRSTSRTGTQRPDRAIRAEKPLSAKKSG